MCNQTAVSSFRGEWLGLQASVVPQGGINLINPSLLAEALSAECVLTKDECYFRRNGKRVLEGMVKQNNLFQVELGRVKRALEVTRMLKLMGVLNEEPQRPVDAQASAYPSRESVALLSTEGLSESLSRGSHVAAEPDEGLNDEEPHESSVETGTTVPMEIRPAGRNPQVSRKALLARSFDLMCGGVPSKRLGQSIAPHNSEGLKFGAADVIEANQVLGPLPSYTRSTMKKINARATSGSPRPEIGSVIHADPIDLRDCGAGAKGYVGLLVATESISGYVVVKQLESMSRSSLIASLLSVITDVEQRNCLNVRVKKIRVDAAPQFTSKNMRSEFEDAMRDLASREAQGLEDVGAKELRGYVEIVPATPEHHECKSERRIGGLKRRAASLRETSLVDTSKLPGGEIAAFMHAAYVENNLTSSLTKGMTPHRLLTGQPRRYGGVALVPFGSIATAWKTDDQVNKAKIREKSTLVQRGEYVVVLGFTRPDGPDRNVVSLELGHKRLVRRQLKALPIEVAKAAVPQAWRPAKSVATRVTTHVVGEVVEALRESSVMAVIPEREEGCPTEAGV